jgi:hypothetical protein
MGDATEAEIAQWMADRLDEQGRLHQSDAVREIAHRYGTDSTYLNRGGNLAISASVLAEFRDLTGDVVVWDRRRRLWRHRTPYDAPGRSAQGIAPQPAARPHPTQAPAASGLQQRLSPQKETLGPRPSGRMSDDERAAFTADMRTRTAELLARKAIRKPAPSPSPARLQLPPTR